MARRTKDDADKTRASILANAADLFETAGYSATSIDDICIRSGTTKGALFHHFKSKKALFLEIWTRLQLEMVAAAQAGAVAGMNADDPYTGFLAGCRVYLEWTTRVDYRTIVLVDGPSVLGQASWRRLDYELGLQNMRDSVKHLVNQGLIEADHAEAMSILFQGALNGIGYSILHQPPPVTLDEAYAAFESMVRSVR